MIGSMLDRKKIKTTANFNWSWVSKILRSLGDETFKTMPIWSVDFLIQKSYLFPYEAWCTMKGNVDGQSNRFQCSGVSLCSLRHSLT